MKVFWKKERTKAMTLDEYEYNEFIESFPIEQRERVESLINKMVGFYKNGYRKGHNKAMRWNFYVWAAYLLVAIGITIFKGHII